jgi:hypothetical protein
VKYESKNFLAPKILSPYTLIHVISSDTMEKETKSSKRHEVVMNSSAFQKALAIYVDDNKPDPIVRRQLEAWKMEWKNLEDGNDDTVEDNGDDESDFARTNVSSQRNVIRGTLNIQGEYVSVTLLMECSWRHPKEDTDHAKKSDGMLTFSCSVDSAKLLLDKHHTEDDEDAKADRKIRKKMIQRLRQDSYIAKLLELGNEQSTNFYPYLAKAKIHVHQAKNVLEERVDVSETVAESVRRALWSLADSSLDVIEVILALPSLPGTSHKDLIDTTTTLANRAKLRLLEDAMLDECEKEGEGELIRELTIEQKEGQDDKEQYSNHRMTEASHKKKKSRSKR